MGFFVMSKHIFIVNKDGGYFYRIYPKLSRLKFSTDKDKSVQRDLFNPLPDFDTHFLVSCIYGKFIDKFNDKGLTIELLSKGEFIFTRLLTGHQEKRILQSKILIVVNESIYNYPFEKGKIYSINLNEIKDITP